MGLAVHVRWQACGTVVGPAPLAVVLPWVWADNKYINKYAQLCNAAGWDVLIAEWPMQAMWFTPWTRSLALSLLEILGSELQSRGERPLVFYAFSGSIKGIFSSLLSLLSGRSTLTPQQAAACSAVLRCCCGVIYDSAPVDFTSATGRRLLTSTPSHHVRKDFTISAYSPAGKLAAAARSTAQSVVDWSICTGAEVLDFFLLELFEKDREAMWSSLHHPAIPGPYLFLYSRSDDLADAAQISDLAASLRQRGYVVTEQVWQDSPHCGHYRHSPVQYEDSVKHLLTEALQTWTKRKERIDEARQLAARWQDNDLTQQQLEEQILPAEHFDQADTTSGRQEQIQQQQKPALVREPTRCQQQPHWQHQPQLLPHSQLIRHLQQQENVRPIVSGASSNSMQGSYNENRREELKPEGDSHGCPNSTETRSAAHGGLVCLGTAASAHSSGYLAEKHLGWLQQQRQQVCGTLQQVCDTRGQQQQHVGAEEEAGLTRLRLSQQQRRQWLSCKIRSKL